MSKTLYFFVTILCFYGTSAQSTLQTVNGTISIRLGTTAGCSDAARYIHQVVETYELYKQFLNIEFVPWGRTRRENNTLICQFGEADCWANRVKRCVINFLSGNLDAQVEYMLCEFSTLSAIRDRSYACARNVGLSLIDLDYCVSTTGDALEAAAEEVSTPAIATINFIPFIVFNNNIDLDLQVQAYDGLRRTVCFALADDPSTGITHCRI